MSRESPFELAFAPWRDRFPRIRESLDGEDPRDRDRFLLNREVAALLLELRPDEGYGEGTEAMAALIHHGYLFWESGEVVQTVQAEQLGRIIAPSWTRTLRPSGRPAVLPSYVQLPPFAVWGVLEAVPPEPLDGWFASRPDQTLQVLAVFGIRPGRAGFTTLEVAGKRPDLARRDDGAPLFAPLEFGSGLPAGPGTVTSEAELLELAWRIEASE
jgi:hypothetical protein